MTITANDKTPIQIIAPGSSSKIESIENAIQKLQQLQYHVQFDPQIFSDHPYLSTPDEQRFLFLKKALLQEEVLRAGFKKKRPLTRVLWCARGGYGCLRLMSRLKKLKKISSKSHLFKWLVGYSDITSLHLFFNHQWDWPTIHGPVFESWGEKRVDPKDLQETLLLLHLLSHGKKAKMNYPLQPMNALAAEAMEDKSVKQAIKGQLTGGNLTVLVSHLGTPFLWKSGKKILLLEDIGERGYRIDRYLTQLKLSSAFKNIQAIVFGEFIGGQESDGKNHVEMALNDFADTVGVPCFRSHEFGHGNRNRPVVFGQEVKIYKNELRWESL